MKNRCTHRRGARACVARGLPVVLFGTVAFAACGDATAPLPTEGAPRELAFEWGGFALVSYTVRLAGDTIIATSASDALWPPPPRVDVARRVPSADEWRAFWSAVADAGVRRWAGACSDASVVDGAGFSFTLAWSDARRTGVYSNAYPTRAGTCRGSTDEAKTFTAAVYKIAGIRFGQPIGDRSAP